MVRAVLRSGRRSVRKCNSCRRLEQCIASGNSGFESSVFVPGRVSLRTPNWSQTGSEPSFVTSLGTVGRVDRDGRSAGRAANKRSNGSPLPRLQRTLPASAQPARIRQLIANGHTEHKVIGFEAKRSDCV